MIVLKGCYDIIIMAETIIIICVGVFAIITICIMSISARDLGRMAYHAI